MVHTVKQSLITALTRPKSIQHSICLLRPILDALNFIRKWFRIEVEPSQLHSEGTRGPVVGFGLADELVNWHVQKSITQKTESFKDDVSERLRSQPAKLMCFARECSNHSVVVTFLPLLPLFLHLRLKSYRMVVFSFEKETEWQRKDVHVNMIEMASLPHLPSIWLCILTSLLNKKWQTCNTAISSISVCLGMRRRQSNHLYVTVLATCTGTFSTNPLGLGTTCIYKKHSFMFHVCL